MSRLRNWPLRADHEAVWRIAWPMIVSNLSVPLLGLVDAAILGHLPDPRYLGAVAVATSLFGFLYWAFGFLRMGTTGLVAQRSGTAASTAAERLARDGALRLLTAQSVLLAIAIAGAVMLAAPWLFPLGPSLMGAPPEIASEAELYFRIRLASAPAVLVTYALTGLLVGLQDTRAVLLVMVATNVVNIVLDVLLVPVLGLRTAGVASATLLAEWLGCVLALLLARRRLTGHPAPLDRNALRQLEHYRELLAVNGHLFLRTLVLLGTLAFFTAQGARQGPVVLAANALLVNLLMTTSYGLDGFAHASEALTGRHYGARDVAAFTRTFISALLFCLATACAFTALFALAGETLVALLTDLTEVRALAADYLPWLALLPLVAVWCFLFDGVAIGLTATREMRDTMLISALLVFLPLWWLTRGLGNTGLWLALVAFFAARGLSLGVWLAAGQRRGRFF